MLVISFALKESYMVKSLYIVLFFGLLLVLPDSFSATRKKQVVKKATVTHSGKVSKVARATRVVNKAAARRELAVVVQPRATRSHLERRVVTVHGRRKVVYQRVAAVERAVPSVGDLAGLQRTPDPLELKSSVAYVVDQANSQVLFEKNANVALPMASITKLMTSLVVVEANQDMDEFLTITEGEIDHEKFTSSRLKVGTQLTRGTMLHLALMSSENRAAAVLGRNYPGGITSFVRAMNAKARALGMNESHYVDASGLSSQNVASASDLVKLVNAAYQHPIIRLYSTYPKLEVAAGGQILHYHNTNNLVANPDWDIGLQKTGYISEAGRCLVMQAKIEGRPVVMVFLDSKGKQSRLGDAGRIRRWLEELKEKALSIERPGARG
jgi:serine-type D-Ala-D-Ala endopeptidase (penicillin-binding protein 7)